MSAENISYDLKRFTGIKRDYSEEEVERLRGSIKIEYSLCKNQSKKLWNLLNTEPYVNTLGSLSGNQAVQHAKAGLKAIYLSGWQVAADANTAGEMYPDQSLYPYDSAPKLVETMNNSLVRADQIQHMEIQDGDMKKENAVDYMLPIIADGEAGFGGPLNVFELTKKFIRAGAAGVHFEDQLASEKKCGHMGGPFAVLLALIAGDGDNILKVVQLATDRQLEAVAGSVHGLDEAWLARVRFKFGAQMTHVNTNGFDVVVRFVAPDLFENQGWSDGLSVALQQAVEQFEFQVGESHRGVEPDRFKPLRNKGERSVTEDFVVVARAHGSTITAAEECLHPCLQLLQIKGLGEVVVGA